MSLNLNTARKHRLLRIATKTAMVKKLKYQKLCASQMERPSEDPSFVQIEHNGKIYKYKKRNNHKKSTGDFHNPSHNCLPDSGHLSPGNSNHTKLSYKRACERPPMTVAKRNARERRRVHTVNQTFARLKFMIPSLKQRTKRVSKLRILQACIDYMDKLTCSLTQTGDYRHGNAADYNRDLEEVGMLQQLETIPAVIAAEALHQAASIEDQLYGAAYHPQYQQHHATPLAVRYPFDQAQHLDYGALVPLVGHFGQAQHTGLMCSNVGQTSQLGMDSVVGQMPKTGLGLYHAHGWI